MYELAGVVVLGILAQWLAWKTRVPAILPLILTGLAVGPIAQEWLGYKWIDPVFNGTSGIFAGNNLHYFVSLAIGVILFEGGLTLKIQELRGIGKAIFRLISIGSLVTFIGSGWAAWSIMGLDPSLAFLFAALIIVTGPTVIAPILRNVPLSRNVATVLKWEGILIDPVGALVAVIVYELIIAGHGTIAFDGGILLNFARVIFVGGGLGFFAAWALAKLINREFIPHYLLNVFTLAAVIGTFAFSDALEHESGLLAVVVMGMAMANREVPYIKEILDFKEAITILLVSVLFILLAANINWSELELLIEQWHAFVLFAVVVLVIRPLGVFLSSFNSGLSTKEKLFISWVGPRGIVAAGVASLFGLRLTEGVRHGDEIIKVAGAEILTPLVFLIVLGTVLLNATTARLVARLLGVTRQSDGILIVGAHHGARLIGKYLTDAGRHVVLIDNNETRVAQAKTMGLSAIQENIFNDHLENQFDLLDMAYLFAMTANEKVNSYACRNFSKSMGEKGVYYLRSEDEAFNADETVAEMTLFGRETDYINFSEIAHSNPVFHEIALESQEHFIQIMEQLKSNRQIPLFVKRKNGKVGIVTGNYQTMNVESGEELVMMGEALEAVES